jgi:hypothetical protein
LFVSVLVLIKETSRQLTRVVVDTQAGSLSGDRLVDLVVAVGAGIGFTAGSGRECPADGTHVMALKIAALVFLDSIACN